MRFCLRVRINRCTERSSWLSMLIAYAVGHMESSCYIYTFSIVCRIRFRIRIPYTAYMESWRLSFRYIFSYTISHSHFNLKNMNLERNAIILILSTYYMLISNNLSNVIYVLVLISIHELDMAPPHGLNVILDYSLPRY